MIHWDRSIDLGNLVFIGAFTHLSFDRPTHGFGVIAMHSHFPSPKRIRGLADAATPKAVAAALPAAPNPAPTALPPAVKRPKGSVPFPSIKRTWNVAMRRLVST
ncbi:hypothetical protein TCAL_16900 [Tigriopus californicus]|uniref:Uncharacterized protein n=1 Tax=Tigriopus californicus TaxID=6832 RepID=A0A553P8A1_TIGCA|nr:hypothetical protein TCAL_16900 [Tigriopus californicus]